MNCDSDQPDVFPQGALTLQLNVLFAVGTVYSGGGEALALLQVRPPQLLQRGGEELRRATIRKILI